MSEVELGLSTYRLDRHDWTALDCPLMRWTGDPKCCRWCDAELPPRRTRWCSNECRGFYTRNHLWSWARSAALRRDVPHDAHLTDWRCAWPDCPGSDDLRERRLPVSLEVDHVEPCEGRHAEFCCFHHVDGLQTLHAVCHELKHHGARSKYAPRDEQLEIA